MKTKFTPLDPFSPLWRQFLSAGTEWIDTYETLRNQVHNDPGAIPVFYAPPFALGISLECIVKALASVHDTSFDPFKRRYRHHTSNIIEDYAPQIAVFNNILKDGLLMELIREYEKTLDTKFGATGVQLDGSEAELLLDTVCSIRNEVLKVSGVKF